MANVSLPRGLFPLRPYKRITYYTANTGQDLFLYQPVVLNNSGQIAVATLGSGNAILGSIVSFEDPAGGHKKRENPFLDVSADGNAIVGVTDDPEQLYLIEEDTGGSALAATNVGNVADFTYQATTGNTTTGLSNAVLDRSGVQTSSAQLLLLGLQRAATGENDYGNYAKWVVKIFDYQFAAPLLRTGV
jgi:hypothetical protein